MWENNKFKWKFVDTLFLYFNIQLIVKIGFFSLIMESPQLEHFVVLVSMTPVKIYTHIDRQIIDR